MDYIKDTISTTRITVCIMERHQAGQEEALVEVSVEEACLGAAHRPRGSPGDRRGCLNCVLTLATVMGLVIVALVAGFILHLFTFTAASRNQDSSPPHSQAEFNITWKQNESDHPGMYDICTVNKTANYIIYGEVTSPKSDTVILTQTRKDMKQSIQSKPKKKGEFIFLEKVNLINGTRISIHFKSTSPTSCHFLVFRL